MEFAGDGKLYIIWPGSGPGGINAYPPKLWRFDGPNSFAAISGDWFQNQPAIAFASSGATAYLPCSQNTPGWGLDNGCRGSSLVVARGSFGAGAATNVVGSVDGYAEGIPGQMNQPVALAISPDDSKLWIADQGNHRIRWTTINPAIDGGPLSSREAQAGGSKSQNCPVCQTGAPVRSPSGEFWHTFEDFTVPGRGVPLELSHTYSSNDAAVAGPLGYGWTMSYGGSLTVNADGSVDVKEENGSRVTFVPNGTLFKPAAARTLAALVHNADGTWSFTRRGALTMMFDATGRLSALRDRNGYNTTLGYDGSGQLATVTDPAGRALTFTWVNGRISAVADPSVPERSVRFAYNAAGEQTDYTDPAGGVWHFTYDASHRLLTMRDPRQAGVTNPPVIANRYDSQGRVEAQADRTGATTSFDYTSIPNAVKITDPRGAMTVEYFESGLPSKVTKGYGTAQAASWRYLYDTRFAAVNVVIDPNGRYWQTSYDNSGNIAGRTDPLGRSTAATFNAFNEPLTFTDADNVTTTNTYDSAGNLLSSSTPLVGATPARSEVTTYNYEDASHPGDVTSITDPNGKLWLQHYDAAGNRDAATDPLGNRTTWTHNRIGWPLTQVSPRGNAVGGAAAQHTTTFSYNGFGDVLTVTDPLGNQSINTYDPNRNLVSSRDPNLQTTTFVYDAENRRTETRRADGSIVKTAYWPDGLVKTQTDPAAKTTSYGYDALGRLTAMTDPLSRTTSYGYDSNGNRISMIDASNRATTYMYDAANQLTGIDYSDPATRDVTAIGYDADGQRISMTDSAGTSRWAYDSLHRLSSSSTPGAGTVGYGYDLAGHLTSIAYPNGVGTVTRGFDDAGRLRSVTDWLGKTSTFDYDADANPTVDSYGNGTSTIWTVDDANRLVDIVHKKNTTTIGSFSYQRDANGQETQVTSTGVPADDHRYDYNQLNFLTNVDTPASTHGYDSADNLNRLPDGRVRRF